MKILIVDDDVLNIKVLQEILQEHEYDTICAQDGLEALKKLEQYDDIDVVLLDRMMPNMGGMEVMEKIRANPKWSSKPVIMQTAANAPKDVIEGTAAGVYYYLTKPFEEKVLLSVVRAAIDNMKEAS